MVDGAVNLMLNQIQSFEQVDDVVTSLRLEPVVVLAGHVHRKLESLAWGDSLAEATDIFDEDLAFDVFLVNIVEGHICDDEGSLLGPLEHIGLLNFVGEKQFLA